MILSQLIFMKKFYLLFVFLLCSTQIHAQDIDSLETAPKLKTLTDIQRDTVLVNIQKSVDYLASSKLRDKRDLVGRYKVYRTANIYNNLMLDTATGKITALQISTSDDDHRIAYTICEVIEYDLEWQIIGRYELYPTGNNNNFILLDTLLGFSYQVQWSTKSSECGIWRIR